MNLDDPNVLFALALTFGFLALLLGQYEPRHRCPHRYCPHKENP